MKFNNEALAAYNKGVADGTITDTVTEIISILEHQEIVSYCSEHGTYSFDGNDIITVGNCNMYYYDIDLTGHTDAELSMFVFNTAEYYNLMIDLGLLQVTNRLRLDGIEYTVAQFDMLCRDYHADQQEREENA